MSDGEYSGRLGGSKIRALRGQDQGSQGDSKEAVGGNKGTGIKEEVLRVLKGPR